MLCWVQPEIKRGPADDDWIEMMKRVAEILNWKTCPTCEGKCVVPVKSEAKIYTIEVLPGTPIYDRPFNTAKIIGTFDGLGGGYFLREYLGWYVIELHNEVHVFINKQDAVLIERSSLQ